MEKNENDTRILFPDVVVGGITIRPWSFGTVVQIAPALEQIIDKVKSRGLKDKPITEIMISAIPSILPEVSAVLAVTLRMEKEKIEALDMDTIIGIILVVVNQNIGYLKNVFGLLIEILGQLGTDLKG